MGRLHDVLNAPLTYTVGSDYDEDSAGGVVAGEPLARRSGASAVAVLGIPAVVIAGLMVVAAHAAHRPPVPWKLEAGFGAFFLATLLALAAVVGRSAAEARVHTARGRYADAVIVGAEALTLSGTPITRDFPRQQYRLFPVVRFVDHAGALHEQVTRIPTLLAPVVGSAIEVVYDPLDPEWVVPSRHRPRSLNPMVLAFFFAPMAIALFVDGLLRSL